MVDSWIVVFSNILLMTSKFGFPVGFASTMHHMFDKSEFWKATDWIIAFTTQILYLLWYPIAPALFPAVCGLAIWYESQQIIDNKELYTILHSVWHIIVGALTYGHSTSNIVT